MQVLKAIAATLIAIIVTLVVIGVFILGGALSVAFGWIVLVGIIIAAVAVTLYEAMSKKPPH